MDKELRDEAYDCASANIRLKNFEVGQKVWLYNTRMKLFPDKLKSKWTGPYSVVRVGNHGQYGIEDFDDHLREANIAMFLLTSFGKGRSLHEATTQLSLGTYTTRIAQSLGVVDRYLVAYFTPGPATVTFGLADARRAGICELHDPPMLIPVREGPQVLSPEGTTTGTAPIFIDYHSGAACGPDSYERGPRQDRGDGNPRWDAGIRTDIPEFNGTSLDPEGFIDWLVIVEEVIEFRDVPENKRACLIATRLRGRASAWWKHLKMTRNRLGKSRIVTWAKMRKCLRDAFLPHNFQRLMYQRLQNLKQGSGSIEEYTTEFYHLVARNDIQETDEQLVARYIKGLRVQIMDSVNAFDLLTIAEAYQRALAFEKQNRRVGGSYSPAPSGRNSGPGSGGPHVVPSQQRSGANNTGSTSKGASSSGVKCFICGETGHRQVDCKQAGKRNLFIESDDEQYEEYEKAPEYDEEPEYEEEFVTGDMGVNLVVRRSCYTLKADGDGWLKHNIFHSTCTILGKVCTFVIDSGSCDNMISKETVQKLALKMESHHKPYKLQCFMFGGVKITLVPSKPKQLATKQSGNLLTVSQFEDELVEVDNVFVLIGKPMPEEVEIPEVMISLLEEFYDVFPDDLPDGLPPLRDINHHVDLEHGSQLPNRPHLRMSPREQEELRRQVEELISKVHVRESMSPCAVPALLSPKKDGTWRMCVDSRAINKITLRYRFPIPRLDDLLDQISGATIITKLDLKSGYYQIRLRPGDEWKTALKTREGLYVWLVMPFGLTNAPRTFMRVMNQLLRPFIGKFVVVYYDEIIIYSASFSEHVVHVKKVLTLLPRDCFYAATKKCVFMTPKDLFLGYVILGDGIQVDESKVVDAQNWPTPTTITEVRYFQGLASFYRRFIPHFSSIMAPMTDCMKGKTFVWTEGAELAFQVIKEKLTTAPVLVLPNFSQVFDLHTDALKVGIGGVLSQGGRPIAYFSEKLTGAMLRYSTYDLEFYAVVQAVKHWRHYLFHKEFVLFTDHDSLRHIRTQDKIS
ncbi:uncharacterized protein LOC143547575 [Bidens hawaiensis]|uniref:uncharacterized protein LOC143547575 n=1 Tax=Bidens hawaiensis TaxID=980011 RepID=UPI00404AB45E